MMLCKVFEDNMICIAISKAPMMTLITKHIAIKYHHFREHVKMKPISINHISVEEQPADFLTNPLADERFRYVRKKVVEC